MDRSYLKAVDTLVSRIKLARDRYYNHGNSPFTNQEYDAMVNTLGILDPSNSILKEIGSPVSCNKISRSEPMFTLEKVTDESILCSRISKLLEQSPVVIYPKYDGASCSLTYVNGKLLVASTRGDGYVGEDVTEFALKCGNIPKDISTIYKGIFEVRGECIIPRIFHEAMKSHGYTAMRNAVVGIMKSSPDVDLCSRVHFIAYEINYKASDIHCLNRIEVEKLLATTFNTEQILGIFNNTKDAVNLIKNFNKDSYKYELDGVVIKPCGLCDIGETIPTHMFAWKYETLIKYSRITNIEAKVGVTGKINIVYKFDPVEFQGAQISSAAGSLQMHNTKWKGVIGDPVGITRINDVIPVIKEITNVHSEEFKPITICPCCGQDLVDNQCVNTLCKDRQLLRMIQYVAGFKIKGIGSSIFEKLYNAGFQTISSLYKVTEEDLRKLPRVGDSLVEKFQKFQTTKISFTQFLSYYPFDNIGGAFIKALTDSFTTEEILNLNIHEVKGASGVKFSKFKSTVEMYSDDIKEVWKIVQHKA